MSVSCGVVYTKKWIVNLILDIAEYTPEKELWRQTILEPSCGNGAFLTQIVIRLIQSAKRDKVLSISQLKNCIRGYDLDICAIEESRLAVKKILVENHFSSKDAENLVNHWIRYGDFLLSKNVKYDYVVGNPPYVKATDIPEDTREKYCSLLSAMTKGCDLYIGFIQKGLECIKNDTGILCYICADRWLQNQYGRKLRGVISRDYHIDMVIRMHEVDAFESEVSAYPAIMRIDYRKGSIKYVECKKNMDENHSSILSKYLMDTAASEVDNGFFSFAQVKQPANDKMLPLTSPEKLEKIKNFMEKFPTLEDSGVKIGIGLATGRDDIFIVHEHDLVEEDRMLPAFNMRDFRRGDTRESWIINPWNEDGSLVELDQYPRLKQYLEKNKTILSKRHIAQKNGSVWYRTIDKVNWSIMNKPMLLFPDLASHASPVLSDGSKYPCHNCYWLISEEWDIKTLGGLLMSDLAESFIDALGVKMRGKTLRFQAQYLRLIHVPKPEDISKEVAEQLQTAFEKNDRTIANRAALRAYGVE